MPLFYAATPDSGAVRCVSVFRHAMLRVIRLVTAISILTLASFRCLLLSPLRRASAYAAAATLHVTRLRFIAAERTPRNRPLLLPARYALQSPTESYTHYVVTHTLLAALPDISYRRHACYYIIAAAIAAAIFDISPRVTLMLPLPYADAAYLCRHVICLLLITDAAMSA